MISEKKIDAIEKNIQSTLGRQNIPGVGVGIVSQGELVYAKGFGVADKTTGASLTTNTVFRIASISKLLTAVAVMQLLEEGRIRLDDPINQHLKSFQIKEHPRATDPITVRHLLTHTSGLGELAPLLNYLNYWGFFGTGRPGWELLKLEDFYKIWLRPDTIPGQRWTYANQGFAALGQMIADIDGVHFADAMRKRVLDPLEMNRSDFLRREPVLDEQALGHWGSGEPVRPLLDREIITMADGSLFTTIEDFSKFAIAVTTDGNRLVNTSTLNQMFRPQFQLDKRLSGMGLGFMLSSRLGWNGHTIASHDGSWIGFTTAFYLAPKLNLGAYVFTNSNNSGAVHLAFNTLRTLIPDDKPQFPMAADPTPAVWPDLVGRYRPRSGWNSNVRLWLSYGAQFKISAHEGKLWLNARYGSWREPVELKAADVNDPLAFTANRVPIIFKRNSAGQVDRLFINKHEFFKRA